MLVEYPAPPPPNSPGDEWNSLDWKGAIYVFMQDAHIIKASRSVLVPQSFKDAWEKHLHPIR